MLLNISDQSKIERKWLSDSCKITKDAFAQFSCQEVPKEMKKMCLKQGGRARSNPFFISNNELKKKTQSIYYAEAKNIGNNMIQKSSKLKEGGKKKKII